MTSIVRRIPIRITPELSAAIDFLRWTSALLVLVGHVRAMLFPPYEAQIFPGLATKLFYLITGYGHQAVMIFFVLSGFLVGGSVIEKLEQNKFNIAKYLIDRFSRLYPVFFVCLFFGGALDWFGMTLFNHAGIYNASQENPIGVIGYDAQSRLGAINLLLNLFMLQGIFGLTFGSNGPLWSIAMEFWYYIAFPLLLIPLYAKNWSQRLIQLLVLAPTLYLLSLNIEFLLLFPIWMLGAFIRKIRLPIKSTFLSFAILLVFLGNARFGYGVQVIRDFLVAVGCALVISSILNGGSFTLIGEKISTVLSGFSYSLYAFHFPMIAFIVSAINFNVNESNALDIYRYSAFTLIIILCIFTSYALSRITEARTPELRNFLNTKLLLRAKSS